MISLELNFCLLSAVPKILLQYYIERQCLLKCIRQILLLACKYYAIPWVLFSYFFIIILSFLKCNLLLSSNIHSTCFFFLKVICVLSILSYLLQNLSSDIHSFPVFAFLFLFRRTFFGFSRSFAIKSYCYKKKSELFCTQLKLPFI